MVDLEELKRLLEKALKIAGSISGEGACEARDAIRNLKPRSDMVCVPRHVLEELSVAIHDMEGSGMEITELLDHAWGQLTVVLTAAKEGE